MKKFTMKTVLVGSLAASIVSGSILQTNALGASTNGTQVDHQIIVSMNKNVTGEHVITLITGDVVKVSTLGNGKHIINVEPAQKNGDGVRVITAGEDTFVYPNSVMPYLAAGKLDQDLFNITKLIEYGYDDKNAAALPVIVEYEESKARSFSSKGTSAPKGFFTAKQNFCA
ncbi:hypothetical protein LC085_01230 [Bacillus tianshenii]|uniref:hypothetical protein n=1 Tax=Sutcliffiella tianshenii TaxID=1463404 RepID=UPI001CD738EA|nr:hypothetical protein [Bacillus tianshenii]MCA1318514.1 hypothetical protein [Bacillus tianshenii]